MSGVINPENFSPYPKNPVIARFFREIGRADELGSGMRKLIKYGKAYGGTDPEMIEGDIFRIIVKCPDFETRPAEQADKRDHAPTVTPTVRMLLALLQKNGECFGFWLLLGEHCRVWLRQGISDLERTAAGGWACSFASFTLPHSPTGLLQRLRAEERSCCNQPFPLEVWGLKMQRACLLCNTQS